MIAGTPPAIVMFFRRMKEERKARQRKREPLEGGALVDEKQTLRLPPPEAHPDSSTALTQVPPPLPPRTDILALPDRDHLRTVVPDYDQLDY